MKPERKHHAHFESGRFYHIYNHGNSSENIFYCDENYDYFLRQFEKYFFEWVDLYVYCLMPNHFHLLIGIKELPERIDLNKILAYVFRNFFISYSQAINKQQKRNGSLFQKRFKRILVEADEYFIQLIQYIHHNPIHHKFVTEYSAWKYSSYNTIISNQPTKLRKNEVLAWFGGRDGFIDFHEVNKKIILRPDQIY
jgi:putative transposase